MVARRSATLVTSVHGKETAMPGVAELAHTEAAMVTASGVPLGLVRLAAGTEDTADLVVDVLAAADTLT